VGAHRRPWFRVPYSPRLVRFQDSRHDFIGQPANPLRRARSHARRPVLLFRYPARNQSCVSPRSPRITFQGRDSERFLDLRLPCRERSFSSPRWLNRVRSTPTATRACMAAPTEFAGNAYFNARKALTWASSYSEGDSPRCHSYRSSCAIRPTQFAHFTFPISGTVFRAHPLSP